MGFWNWLWGRERDDLTASALTSKVVITRATSRPPADYVSPYLDSARESELLVLNVQGLPPLRMKLHRGEWWMAEESTGLLVNAGDRKLRGLGVWTVRVRGDAYAPGTLRVGHVDLVREPDNEHDPNAIAIMQRGVRCGYWNKSMAKGLAKLLDSGAVIDAVAISADPPKVVAAEPRILKHITRGMG